MTVQEMIDKLKETEQKLEGEDVSSQERRNLQIFILQLENEMIARSFDTLKELDEVEVPDLAKLKQLTADVHQEVEALKAGGGFVGKLIGVAKGVLGSALPGFPVNLLPGP